MRAFIPILLTLLLLAQPVWADGLSSRVGGGLIVINQADNLSGRGYSIINDLNEKPRSFNRLMPFPLLDVRYAWDNNLLSFGTPVDEPAGITLGYRRKLDKGVLAGSMFYSFLGREWQNPYLVGVARTDTQVHTYGGRVAFEDIFGSPMTLAVKGTVKAVVKEGLTDTLRRDGGVLDLDLSWRQRLDAEWSLVPFIAYQRGEYVGSANNFHGCSLGLGTNWRKNDLLISTRLAGTMANYDNIHPVFGRKRRDNGYRASALLTLNNPFNWQRWFASAGIMHNRSGSNINFFENSTTLGFALLGYQF